MSYSPRVQCSLPRDCATTSQSYIPTVIVRTTAFLWKFIVLSQQLSGAAMVRRWPAYIHPRLVGVKCAVLVAVMIAMGGHSGAQVRR